MSSRIGWVAVCVALVAFSLMAGGPGNTSEPFALLARGADPGDPPPDPPCDSVSTLQEMLCKDMANNNCGMKYFVCRDAGPGESNTRLCVPMGNAAAVCTDAKCDNMMNPSNGDAYNLNSELQI